LLRALFGDVVERLRKSLKLIPPPRRHTPIWRACWKTKDEFAEAQESLGRALALQVKREEVAKHYEAAVRVVKSRAAGDP